MSLENMLWGAPRIHGELLKLGFTVAESTVTKYMAKQGHDHSGQGCITFLRNHMPNIAAIDLFVVPTIGFRLLALIIWDQALRYLIRDRDAVYSAVVTRRLRVMGIRGKPITAGSLWRNGFAERLIGTFRRECVDQVITRARRTCVGRSSSSLTITTRCAFTALWHRMYRSVGRPSDLASSPHARPLAVSTTSTAEYEGQSVKTKYTQGAFYARDRDL
jgi:transposase InsO family protein